MRKHKTAQREVKLAHRLFEERDHDVVRQRITGVVRTTKTYWEGEDVLAHLARISPHKRTEIRPQTYLREHS